MINERRKYKYPKKEDDKGKYKSLRNAVSRRAMQDKEKYLEGSEDIDNCIFPVCR